MALVRLVMVLVVVVPLAVVVRGPVLLPAVAVVVRGLVLLPAVAVVVRGLWLWQGLGLVVLLAVVAVVVAVRGLVAVILVVVPRTMHHPGAMILASRIRTMKGRVVVRMWILIVVLKMKTMIRNNLPREQYSRFPTRISRANYLDRACNFPLCADNVLVRQTKERPRLGHSLLGIVDVSKEDCLAAKLVYAKLVQGVNHHVVLFRGGVRAVLLDAREVVPEDVVSPPETLPACVAGHRKLAARSHSQRSS
jgi:hypothetical protein